ncbi:MAG: OmpA family protein, partial [Alphaproteobacteria bacterium]
GAESETAKPADRKGKRSGADKPPPKNSEAALFSNPYEALDQIAAQAAKEAPARAITEKGNVPAHHTGEEFRDPFDPDFQHGQFQQGKIGGETGKKDDGAATTAKSDGDKSEPSHAKAETAREGSDNDKRELSPARADKGHEAERDRDSKRADLKRDIQDAVARAGFSIIPGIDVQATRDGLLISITDQYNFEMFGIASARPKPELVVLMEKIGGIIAKRPEHLVIRGHTDGRPFRSRDYDNWRLSTARAQMANYMLVRSGVTEARVDRIEGHADHDLRVRDDPLAAPNRRIEILLEDSKP